MDKPIEKMTLQEVKDELKSYNITQKDIDRLVNRVERLFVPEYELESEYFEPWQVKGDCQMWLHDQGSIELRLEHPAGRECARYLNKDDCERMIAWLTKAVEKMG